MSRLDEIKARGAVVRAKQDNCEATYSEFAAIIRLANFDVPALVAAVEAVLALHQPIDPDSIGRNRRCCSCSAVYGSAAYPCDTVTAIRDALGETE